MVYKLNVFIFKYFLVNKDLNNLVLYIIVLKILKYNICIQYKDIFIQSIVI